MTGGDPAETFRQEAQDLLDQLEQALLDLEHQPGDATLIDSAFRALHTIKGSGAMFGFDAMAAFTHHVETAFDLVRKGKVPAGPRLIAIALAAKDQIRILIERPATADAAAGAAILRDIRAIIDGPPAPAAKPDAATWRIRFRLARDAMAMGTNPLLLLDELRSLGAATVVVDTDAVPVLESLDPTACYLAWDVVLTTDRPRSDIEQVFLFVIDDMELDIERIEPAAGIRRLGEILIDRGAVEPASVDAALARQEPIGTLLVKGGDISPATLTAALAEQQHLRSEPRVVKAVDSIRVPAARLDELMDRVGELVIAQSRLKQVGAASADGHVKAVAEEIERLVMALRDTTMGIRMVPIASLFGRFRRLVHDLAHDLGKEIALVTVGEDTELDKTVIERLNDPLVHLIRNAVDHGLETPAERRAAGKFGEGRITLSARHSGAEVLISIVDDGRGLDRRRIQAKAEEQGLLAPGARPPDHELFQLLFEPGFSTAHQVTSLSGRGVGMDVVRRTIVDLRGTIDLASTEGGGTTVTLRLPLTLAIIDGLLVQVGTGRYVIPLAAVEECVELTPEADARSTGRNFLNIRGDLVPFIRLRDLFNARTPPDRYQKIVIVGSGDMRIGLVVDLVIGDHQTVIKSLSSLHTDIGSFSGATILGDGTVALILDVPRLVDFARLREDQIKAVG